MRKSSKLCISLGILLTLPLSAATIHVPGDQSTIQAGIDAASTGDIVLVSDGTYSGAGNINLDFGGKAITVLSENGAAAGIIDCQQGGRGFSFSSGEGPDSILEGFSILNGMAEDGAGIYCEGTSPTITAMTIMNCEAAERGGAICGVDSSLTISDSTVEGNTARQGGGISCEGEGAPEIIGSVITGNTETWRGGGIYDNTTGQSLISECTISNNTGSGIYGVGPITISGNNISGNDGGWGGGIEAYWHDVIIEGNIISSNSGYYGGGLGCVFSGLIRDNLITGNTASDQGGGIHIDAGDSLVINNTISDNWAGDMGGGIYFSGVTFTGTIAGNRIISNQAHWGGGICCFNAGAIATVSNNLIATNLADSGGGICCHLECTPYLTGNTVTNNTATHRGGGLSCFNRADVIVTDSIFWGNQATYGYQLDLGSSDLPSTLTISYSNTAGGRPDVFVAPNCTLNWGEGMIDEDPLFVSGPMGSHYLSQVAAGQPETSPCVDAGDPSSDLPDGTTRTDERPDTGVADMGFHSPAGEIVPRPNVISGPGPSPDNQPLIRVFPPEQDASRINAFQAYGAPHYGVNVTTGDIDGDELDEIISGPGPGPMYGPHVRAFEVDGTPLPGLNFMAYGTAKYGVNVAAGNFNGDDHDEIITGAGPGEVFGPHVRGWDYDSTSGVTAVSGVNFFAYGTPKWGVSVAAGDIDGDGFDEIITGAGPGSMYGAHVRGWNVDSGTAAAIPQISYFAYNTPRYGVRVACGDIDGDGMDEIITTPGPSQAFGAHVRGWNFDGSTLTAMPGVSFFAWPPEEVRYGACISSGTDLNGDGRDEIVVGAGPDPVVDTLVKVYTFDGSQTALWFSLQAFPDGWTYGASVAAGRF